MKLRMICVALAGALCATHGASAAVVQLTMNLGLNDPNLGFQNKILIETFDDRPLTSNNFLAYVKGGKYSGTFLHRLAPGFVLQGGGFIKNLVTQTIGGVPQTSNLANPVDLDGDPATPNPTVPNEFSNLPFRSNLRGTLAMAKLAGDPNSATNQWFFNLADNSANLDNQNGGFTVFARVIDGMDLVDALAGLPITNLNPDTNGDGIRDPGPFGSVPFSGSFLVEITAAEVAPAAPLLPAPGTWILALGLLGATGYAYTRA
ncbi:MAG: peptidylprolyl isomerase [Myxococcota bacterium]